MSKEELIPADVYLELLRLREEVKGPDGYATWKDAAVAKKIENVKLRQQIKSLSIVDLTIKYFVCGFLFSPDLTKVVLIRKNRGPIKMAGKLNGVGGKVKLNETKKQAQTREFLEETGVTIPENNWRLISVDVFPTEEPNITANCVYFFAAVSEDYYKVKTVTDEQVSVFDTNSLMGDLSNEKLLNNLYFLIPLSIRLLKKRHSILGHW